MRTHSQMRIAAQEIAFHVANTSHAQRAELYAMVAADLESKRLDIAAQRFRAIAQAERAGTTTEKGIAA